METPCSPDRDELDAAFAAFDRGRYGDAFRRYLPLAEAGSVTAQLAVGWMLHEGRGVDQDFVKARCWFEKAADAGSREGLFYLGVLSRAEQRYLEAIQHLERSASMDYMPAIYVLGLMHERGEGVGVDKDKAWRFYERAAKLGHLFAQREIAARMIRGQMGLMQIPIGLYLFVRTICTGFMLALRDPLSDRIRAAEDYRWVK
jgi:TPR repeat protein